MIRNIIYKNVGATYPQYLCVETANHSGHDRLVSQIEIIAVIDRRSVSFHKCGQDKPIRFKFKNEKLVGKFICAVVGNYEYENISFLHAAINALKCTLKLKPIEISDDVKVRYLPGVEWVVNNTYLELNT